MAIVSSRLAQERPEEIALRDERVAFGWAEVDDALNRVANGLHAVDLGPDRRFAVFAQNSAETVLAHLGGLLAGASSVPANFHLNEEELAFILEDSGARALFVGPETAEIGLAAAKQAGVPLVVGWRCPDQVGITPWVTWVEGASSAEPPTDVPPRPNLMYTSGTTGRPKGVELPPTMFAGGASITEHVEALAENAFAQFGTHLVIGPMYHTGPLSGVRLLAVGVPVVVLSRFDAEGVLRAIETYGAETSVMVPTHFARLLALPDDVRARYDVSSIKMIVHTGAACPIDVKRTMIEWWGPVFFDSYGATEVGTTCMITSQEWLEHPGSVGRAVPPFTAIVVDDDGNELPPGVEGRLFFEDATGRGVVYPKDPQKTRRGPPASRGLHPGRDRLRRPRRLRLHHRPLQRHDRLGWGQHLPSRGRARPDQAPPGGRRRHHRRARAPTWARRSRRWSCPVDPADPPVAADLIAYCREQLAGYKCPRSVDIVETVGRTAMGKVNKRLLRAPFWSSARTIG